ncbi:MAG: replication-associated recombination protein A [candidate division Zixibacteria bacterium]|nr:replication-associated recombination protein A [candidate division Zixibacteria bacterium]
MTDLFEQQADQETRQNAPLAARMRPLTLDELLGQDDLVGTGRLLRTAIERDTLFSMILWGPPGSGKTTLATLIARATRSHFVSLSAVTAGVKELHQAAKEARDRLGMHRRRTVLFIDEIHRFNKSQQDVTLPHVENGTLTLIGATTENPSFEVNAALLSRCRVLRLKTLEENDLRLLIERALADRERGLGDRSIEIENDALDYLATVAGGDARIALNTLEVAAMTVPCDKDGHRRITLTDIEEAIQHRAPQYDKSGDGHFDAISALHKSVRDSDPDATLYWLARMLVAGDDPLYIARRLIRMAVEDIGMADPYALTLAVAAQQAVHFIGIPEGELALAHAAVYLAVAPKSNAVYTAYGKARDDAGRTSHEPVPIHLRNAPTRLMKDMGHGAGYRYAHDYENAAVDQEHLPETLRDRRYYEPTDRGREQKIREWMRWMEEKKAEGRERAEGAAPQSKI